MERKIMFLPEEILSAVKPSNNEWQEVSEVIVAKTKREGPNPTSLRRYN